MHNVVTGAVGFIETHRCKALQPGNVKRSFADIFAARRDLGYEPDTDLAANTARLLAFYRCETSCLVGS